MANVSAASYFKHGAIRKPGKAWRFVPLQPIVIGLQAGSCFCPTCGEKSGVGDCGRGGSLDVHEVKKLSIWAPADRTGETYYWLWDTKLLLDALAQDLQIAVSLLMAGRRGKPFQRPSRTRTRQSPSGPQTRKSTSWSRVPEVERGGSRPGRRASWEALAAGKVCGSGQGQQLLVRLPDTPKFRVVAVSRSTEPHVRVAQGEIRGHCRKTGVKNLEIFVGSGVTARVVSGTPTDCDVVLRTQGRWDVLEHGPSPRPRALHRTRRPAPDTSIVARHRSLSSTGAVPRSEH